MVSRQAGGAVDALGVSVDCQKQSSRSASHSLLRAVRLADEASSAGSRAAHLQNRLFLDLDVVRHVGGLGVEAASRQDLELVGVEGFAITRGVHAGNDREDRKSTRLNSSHT